MARNGNGANKTVPFLAAGRQGNACQVDFWEKCLAVLV